MANQEIESRGIERQGIGHPVHLRVCLALAGLCLMLGACSTVPASVPGPEARAEPARPAPPPPPAASPQPEIAEPQTATPPPAQPPRLVLAPRPHPPLPETLIGASPETVTRLLGQPALVRQEGQARLWTFAGGACRLAIVFSEGQGQPPVVMALRVTEPHWGAPAPDAATCLQDLTG